MRRIEGFSMVELLVTVAIIGILASIALPQLLRARLAANESSSIGSLRAISSSQANYAATCGSGGFATDLADLVKPPPTSINGFLSPDLASNGIRKSGYILALAKNGDPTTVDILTPSCNLAAGTLASSYFASAVPVSPGQSGNRYFATDTPSTIYVDLAAAVPNPVPPGTSTIQ